MIGVNFTVREQGEGMNETRMSRNVRESCVSSKIGINSLIYLTFYLDALRKTMQKRRNETTHEYMYIYIYTHIYGKVPRRCKRAVSPRKRCDCAIGIEIS